VLVALVKLISNPYGITVVADETVNTAEVIDRNKFIVNIFISPCIKICKDVIVDGFCPTGRPITLEDCIGCERSQDEWFQDEIQKRIKNNA